MCRGSRGRVLGIFGIMLALAAIASGAIEPNLVLPKNWFAEEVAEMQKPAELRTPVGERWRFSPKAAPVNVTVWRQFVFTSYAKLDPSVDVSKLIERQKAGDYTPPKVQYATECRDIETGNVLWSNTEVSGRFVALPGYLLMLFSTTPLKMELVLLESKQGHIVQRFPFAKNADDEMATSKKLRESPLDFAEAWALDTRQGLLRSLFSGESPVPLDTAHWTPEDARLVLDVFSSGDVEYLIRQGAVNGSFLFPNAEDVVLLNTTRHLMYRASSGDRIHWRYICTAGSRRMLLWQSPYVLVFSTATAVTAYRINDGSPAWMYEFQADYSSGGTSNRFASLTDGILLLTGPLHGLSENEYLSLSRPEQEALRPKRSPYLWLTKLDFNGKRLFQQELTMKPMYQKLALSRGFLVLWTEDTLVCYGATEATPTTTPSDGLPPLDEQQRRQEISRLHAEYQKLDSFTGNQVAVCGKLGLLHDRSMLDIVLADFEKAANDPMRRPDYVSMLGALNDRRAIDRLIPFVKDESFTVRRNAEVSLRRLTGLGPTALFPPDWEEWWNRHKALFKE
jgi:hypothetical protein